jgi:hypothetical protein
LARRVEVRHQLHAEVDFRIDRWPTLLGRVPRGRQFPNERQVETAFDPAEEVILRDERIQVDARLGLRLECLHFLHGGLFTENGEDPNAAPSKDPNHCKNQAESELVKVLFFNVPHPLDGTVKLCRKLIAAPRLARGDRSGRRDTPPNERCDMNPVDGRELPRLRDEWRQPFAPGEA